MVNIALFELVTFILMLVAATIGDIVIENSNSLIVSIIAMVVAIFIIGFLGLLGVLVCIRNF